MRKNFLVAVFIIITSFLLAQFWVPIPIPGNDLKLQGTVEFQIDCLDGQTKQAIEEIGLYRYTRRIGSIKEGKVFLQLESSKGQIYLYKFRLRKALGGKYRNVQFDITSPGYELKKITLPQAKIWIGHPNFFKFELLKKEQRTLQDKAFILNTSKHFTRYEFWKVKKSQVEDALKKIVELIDHPELHEEVPVGSIPRTYSYRNIKAIKENWGSFKVQFLGIIKDGKKFIFCNFFWDEKENNTGYSQELKMVDDGGNHYWQVEYDSEKRECIQFFCNGTA